MKRKPPIALIVILILAAAAAVIYYIYTGARPSNAISALTASGTVEAAEIDIAPEIAGKVLEVRINEGDSVKKGEVLIILDGVLLQAQRSAALAALDAAKSSVATANAAVVTANAGVDLALAQYELALAAALSEEKNFRTADWPSISAPDDFTQPSWYFDQAEQLSGAQSEADQAKSDLDAAIAQVNSYEQKSTNSNFIEIEQTLIAARIRFENAKSILDKANFASEDLREAAQTAYDDARKNLTEAQDAYDEAVETSSAQDLLEARAKLRIAQERYNAALDRQRLLETGIFSPKVAAAQKAVDQAKASANQAKTAADQAAQAVKQAEANLALIDAQIQKLTITAPEDGVILKRTIEPGEVVNPGSILLTLGRIADLTITVYIPEDRYGEIKLGQAAVVQVDSFPGTDFNARVIRIADKAEFTPRNVQTMEGRKVTVFAIKLQVEDPGGQLKAGMPADVIFK